MSDYLLCTRGLTKRFGHHHAVDHVNLHIPKGAIYGFIGRNGAGKTTCLKMISGLSKPTEGENSVIAAESWNICVPGSAVSLKPRGSMKI